MNVFELDAYYGAQPEYAPATQHRRGERIAEDTTEVKTLLGLEYLPDQTVSSAEYAAYAQRIGEGDTGVTDELFMRQLRVVYSPLKTRFHDMNQADLQQPNKTLLEDAYQSSLIIMNQNLVRYGCDDVSILKGCVNFAIRSGLKLLSTAYAEQSIESPSQELLIPFDEADEPYLQRAQRYSAEPTMDERAHAQIADSLALQNVITVRSARRQPMPSRSLTPMEHDVLSQLFGILITDPALRDTFTLEEIGMSFRVSRTRIGQIKNDALHKIVQRLVLLDDFYFDEDHTAATLRASIARNSHKATHEDEQVTPNE